MKYEKLLYGRQRVSVGKEIMRLKENEQNEQDEQDEQ